MPVPGPIPARSIRRRFVRAMRVAAALAIVIAAIAVLLVARGQSQLHVPMLITIALGIGLTVLLGVAVVAFSPTNRSGRDGETGATPSESDPS